MRKLSKKEKALAFEAQKLVERFNELYPVGSVVSLRKMASKSVPYIECTVRSSAFVANETDPVAFFNEISGYFSIEPDFVSYPF
jgi:hypothetical protein